MGTQYGVDDVRIGLGAAAGGLPTHLTGDANPRLVYESVATTVEIRPVPEPGTLLLLGAGIVTLGVRRRMIRH
jgi:hypothetical protein